MFVAMQLPAVRLGGPVPRAWVAGPGGGDSGAASRIGVHLWGVSDASACFRPFAMRLLWGDWSRGKARGLVVVRCVGVR